MERLVPGEAPRPIFLEHIARYWFASSLVEGTHVLDIACGSGYGSHELAVLGRAEQVVGVDISEEAIKYARSHYKAENIKFVTGDATSLEFADASFDTVVSFETIEHLTDVAAYLDEVCRVLKPGGSFLVSTPNRRLAFANPFHTVEFTFRQFRKVISDRFADVRFLGQDHLPFSRKLLLEVSVKVSRTLPESIKQHIIPERSRVDDDSRKVAGIVDSQVSSCRFFLALCRK